MTTASTTVEATEEPENRRVSAVGVCSFEGTLSSAGQPMDWAKLSIEVGCGVVLLTSMRS